jgi:hypothetical protein
MKKLVTDDRERSMLMGTSESHTGGVFRFYLVDAVNVFCRISDKSEVELCPIESFIPRALKNWSPAK